MFEATRVIDHDGTSLLPSMDGTGIESVTIFGRLQALDTPDALEVQIWAHGDQRHTVAEIVPHRPQSSPWTSREWHLFTAPLGLLDVASTKAPGTFGGTDGTRFARAVEAALFSLDAWIDNRDPNYAYSIADDFPALEFFELEENLDGERVCVVNMRGHYRLGLHHPASRDMRIDLAPVAVLSSELKRTQGQSIDLLQALMHDPAASTQDVMAAARRGHGSAVLAALNSNVFQVNASELALTGPTEESRVIAGAVSLQLIYD